MYPISVSKITTLISSWVFSLQNMRNNMQYLPYFVCLVFTLDVFPLPCVLLQMAGFHSSLWANNSAYLHSLQIELCILFLHSSPIGDLDWLLAVRHVATVSVSEYTGLSLNGYPEWSSGIPLNYWFSLVYFRDFSLPCSFVSLTCSPLQMVVHCCWYYMTSGKSCEPFLAMCVWEQIIFFLPYSHLFISSMLLRQNGVQSHGVMQDPLMSPKA